MGMRDLREETEQAFIGGLLFSPKQLVNVADVARVEDFKCSLAGKAYGSMLTVWKRGEAIDFLSVVGGDQSLSSYLVEASGNAAASVVKCAREISIQAKADRINAGLVGIHKELKVSAKLDRLLSLYQQEMFIDRKDPEVKAVMKRFDDTIKENRKRKSMGFSTGFLFMDDLYIQYVPGQTWTMGAYTSVGKTAMMIQKICNLLLNEAAPHTLVISTEMTEEQMMARLIGNFTHIPSQRILSGNLHAGEDGIVDKCKAFIASKRLTIYDDVYELNEIETVFRKADLQGGVDVGFIDYVQNCQVSDAKSSYQEQSTLAKRIQKLAKDMRSTIICLSQVSNDVGRGKTDNLELKGAGEWAAVSDVGIMLLRKKDQKYIMKYSIKKNRHGKLHDHFFEYMSDYTRLEATGPV